MATRDSLPYIASVIPEGSGVYAESVGLDCDPVESICVRVMTLLLGVKELIMRM